MGVRTILNPRTGRSEHVQVRTFSFLDPHIWLSPQAITKRQNAAIDAALLAAKEVFGDQEYNVRALRDTDMPGTAAQWVETTAASDAWTTSGFGDGSAIADNLILAIIGAEVKGIEQAAGTAWDGTDVNPAVTGIRIQIGGSLVAEWDLFPILRAFGSVGTDAGIAGPALYPSGLARSPVVVTKEKTLTVQFFETATTLDFTIPLLGYAVEPVGSGAGLNP